MKTILMLAGMSGLLLSAAACASPRKSPRVRIVAVQMAVRTEMYRDLPTFQAEMDKVVADAATRRARTCPTLVALPEDVGLGLVFLGQWDTVKDAKGIREAGAMLGASLAGDVTANALKYGASPTRALLMVANERWLRKAYFDTFSRLSAKYHIYLAAGSAPLCDPGSPDVRNVGVLFGPKGKILGRWSKVHLIDMEGPEGLDLESGQVDDLTVVNTPFGRIGTAVCYDGFHDDVLDHLANHGADFILQPSFNPGVWTPEQETDWATGLWQRIRTHPGVVGVNAMAVGHLFDVICEGRTNIVGTGAGNGGYYGRLKSATQPGMVVVDIPR